MSQSLRHVNIKALPRSDRDKLTQLLTPKTTQYIVHKPYPKQAAFMLLPGKEAFYGGAAGGGKSDALLMCALQYVDVPGYAAIIFRKTFADLVKPGALIDRAREWLAPWTVTKEVHWVEKERKFVFPSGAIIQFGYMETEKDRFNYQGGEYQFIGFDEVTHMSEVCYKYMFSRLRRLEGVNIPLRVRAASNPPDDGDNAEWVYNRFVNPETKAKHVVFIPAGMDDNPHLDTETYKENLEELDPVTRARLKDGNWEITRKGNMFKEEWFEIVPSSAVPKNRRIIRSWDMAASVEGQKNKNPDETATIRLSECQGIFYIEDVRGCQERPSGTNAFQEAIAKQDGRTIPVVEEQEPGSSGIATIENKARTIYKGYTYSGIKSTGSKILRAKPVSAAAEKGLVKIVNTCQPKFLKKLLDQLSGFPAFPHDDYVDALSLAFNTLGSTPIISAPVGVTSKEANYWQMGTTLSETGSSYWSSL